MGRATTLLKVAWHAALFLAAFGAVAQAGQATVAVASNFLTTARLLGAEFEVRTGHTLRLAHGSTGRLYAQITTGAPFDVFLAADQQRPALLESAGLVRARRSYAEGRLVLVGREGIFLSREDLRAALTGRRVALADPEVAPYGAAAAEVMRGANVDPQTDHLRLYFGENVGQTANILVTGNAELAFLSASQVSSLPDADWSILSLDGLHAPVLQDAVLLERAAANDAAFAFFGFLASDLAADILADAGYGVPE